MSNFVRCPRCNAELIDEEFDAHICQEHSPIVRIIDSFSEYHIETPNVIIVKTTDGILYRFAPSPRTQHPKKSPEDAREP
jgi:hypothetical protein